MENLDALVLARLQFAFTIAFHIIFPSFTIGLASFLAVCEGLWLTTRREVFRNLYLFWVKVFAISFGMGVVSGVVMSYQLGTNWSVFSQVSAPVIGPLFAFEVLTAFFLEASFLGIMLFGWKKVGPGLHFTSTVLVAIGTLISAFWIISANSWMQAPAGYAVLPDGTLTATDWWAVVFNPTFPVRLAHMALAAFLTTALAVGGASAWVLLRDRDQPESRMALRMAIGMFAIVAPLQLVVGHASGEIVRDHQPLKLAAIEAYWETRADQPQSLVGIPDRDAAKTHGEIAIPGIGNPIQGVSRDTVLKGLDAWPREDWPVVWLVYWAFRVMVGLGLAMIGLGLWGAWCCWRKGPEANRLFLMSSVFMAPMGFVAVIAGWIVAEVGRQPWVIYGVLRTKDAVSPVGAGQVSASLLAFMVIYAIVFSAGALYILRLLNRGPAPHEEAPTQEDRAPGTPLAAAPDEEAP
ncbi:cytochrome ubiquinol oxidase subunit I [Caulobacter sp. SLTY]|uniref:cytochrome ubiquinol oxidase subunit I n=1 Tax=Caulobacter sp. SLTY TaxID=2683262 RepID=UPI0014123D3C|nr:cytochrome ubiquinol oxidase subunit I [Caulobacter sp. SLTY]NBB14650.1 cytochrome ubiquinol oxidase subunit I [Caulobacter sp. SLTY]